MGAKRVINKVLRAIILLAVGATLFLYLLGIIANIFGLLEMRRSDDKIYSVLHDAAGDRAVVTHAEYEGGKISYAGIRGPEGRNSVAVIFVHGSPGSLDAYTRYLLNTYLQDQAALYTYDRLGYGNTLPNRAGLSLIEHSEQLFAFTKHIGARRNIFVGHSLGCSIMARLAMDHPDVVDGLVMVAAPIDPSLEPSSWWRPLLNFPMIRIAMPHAFRISNDELAPLKKDLEVCLPLWDRVQCPVTFIHGDRDQLVPIANVSFGKKVLQNATRVNELILHQHGHFILWTHEEIIAKEIVKIMGDS